MADVPLMSSILISNGEAPEGLDATVISPDQLDPETLSELQQLASGAAGGDDVAPPDEGGEGDEPPPEEGAEGEPPEVDIGQLQTDAQSKMDEVNAALERCQAIAEKIPDAEDIASEMSDAVEAAQTELDDVLGESEDGEYVQEEYNEFMELAQKALDLSSQAESMVPALDGGASEEEPEPDDTGESDDDSNPVNPSPGAPADDNPLIGWARRTAGR